MIQLKRGEKMNRKIIVSIFFALLGLVLNLLIHEGSHFLFLNICNGNFVDGSFVTESFISGYVDVKYIPLVALSSIFVPLTISCILVFVKQLYVQIFCCAFTISTFMNSLLGLIMNFFEKNTATRGTYDVLLAADYSNNSVFVLFITFAFLVVSGIVIGFNMKRIVDSF